MLLIVLAHVQELAVDQGYLLLRETKRLPIDQLFQHLQLIDDQGLLIGRVYLLCVLAENVVIERILPSLLGTQIQNGARELEEVLGDVFRFAAKLPRISVDEETLFLLL